MLNEEYIRQNADDVLRLCTFYIRDDRAARKIFMETFATIESEISRTTLLRVAHDCCRKSHKSVRYSHEDEIWLYEDLLGLTADERLEIIA